MKAVFGVVAGGLFAVTGLLAYSAFSQPFSDAVEAGGASFEDSAGLADLLDDETGSGAACFATSPTFTTGITTPAIISAAADPADAEFMRLGTDQKLCWESSPADTDACLWADSTEVLRLNMPIAPDATGDPADSGAVRLDNNEGVCWEASPTGTDACATVDSSEVLVLSGINGISIGSDPADSGAIRLVNGVAVAWEASGPGTDITLTVDANEVLQTSNAVAWRLPSVAGTTPAQPLTCNVGYLGAMVAVNDTDDGAATTLCYCGQQADDSTYDWLQVSDNAACPHF